MQFDTAILTNEGVRLLTTASLDDRLVLTKFLFTANPFEPSPDLTTLTNTWGDGHVETQRTEGGVIHVDASASNRLTFGRAHGFGIWGYLSSEGAETGEKLLLSAKAIAPVVEVTLASGAWTIFRIHVAIQFALASADAIIVEPSYNGFVSIDAFNRLEAEVDALEDRVVTTHAKGDAAVGDDQTILGDKTFDTSSFVVSTERASLNVFPKEVIIETGENYISFGAATDEVEDDMILASRGGVIVGTRNGVGMTTDPNDTEGAKASVGVRKKYGASNTPIVLLDGEVHITGECYAEGVLSANKLASQNPPDFAASAYLNGSLPLTPAYAFISRKIDDGRAYEVFDGWNWYEPGKKTPSGASDSVIEAPYNLCLKSDADLDAMTLTPGYIGTASVVGNLPSAQTDTTLTYAIFFRKRTIGNLLVPPRYGFMRSGDLTVGDRGEIPITRTGSANTLSTVIANIKNIVDGNGLLANLEFPQVYACAEGDILVFPISHGMAMSDNGVGIFQSDGVVTYTVY
jgi:hypothetical protein